MKRVWAKQTLGHWAGWSRSSCRVDCWWWDWPLTTWHGKVLSPVERWTGNLQRQEMETAIIVLTWWLGKPESYRLPQFALDRSSSEQRQIISDTPECNPTLKYFLPNKLTHYIFNLTLRKLSGHRQNVDRFFSRPYSEWHLLLFPIKCTFSLKTHHISLHSPHICMLFDLPNSNQESALINAYNSPCVLDWSFIVFKISSSKEYLKAYTPSKSVPYCILFSVLWSNVWRKDSLWLILRGCKQSR